MKAKSNKGKMPGGAPKGMNPLEFFRKGGEQRKAMFKKGGYNTPTQNPLPKRYMGGDDPIPPSQGGNSGMIMNPYAIKKPNVSSVTMGNPFVKSNPLTDAMNYKPSITARPVVTAPSTTSTVTAPTATNTVSSTVPAAPSFKEKKKALKEQGKLDKIQRKLDIKKAKDENLQKQYESGERKAATVGDKIDRAVKVGETVIGGINAVNQLRQPMGGGMGMNRKGGSIKPKASKGMIVKTKKK